MKLRTILESQEEGYFVVSKGGDVACGPHSSREEAIKEQKKFYDDEAPGDPGEYVIDYGTVDSQGHFHKKTNFHESQGGFYQVTIKDCDIFQPDDCIVDPFSITIEYDVGASSHEDHPYGDGSARENFKGELEVKAVYSAEPVKILDSDTEKLIRTLPKHTPVEKIPGYEVSFDNWFAEQAEKDDESN